MNSFQSLSTLFASFSFPSVRQGLSSINLLTNTHVHLQHPTISMLIFYTTWCYKCATIEYQHLFNANYGINDIPFKKSITLDINWKEDISFFKRFFANWTSNFRRSAALDSHPTISKLYNGKNDLNFLLHIHFMFWLYFLKINATYIVFNT